MWKRRTELNMQRQEKRSSWSNNAYCLRFPRSARALGFRSEHSPRLAFRLVPLICFISDQGTAASSILHYIEYSFYKLVNVYIFSIFRHILSYIQYNKMLSFFHDHFFLLFFPFFQRESLRCMSTVAKFPQAQAQWGWSVCVCVWHAFGRNSTAKPRN